MEVLHLLPSFNMKTHGMHMTLSVEGMDLNLVMSHYVWSTHEEEHEEEHEEPSQQEEEVDLKHEDLTSE